MILMVIVVRFGAAPFEHGLAATGPLVVVLGLLLTAVATLCCAWRWRSVSAALGEDLPLRVGIAACYRAQFLNATLPGGVLGDVHRALARGREVGRTARVAGTVVWERTLGLVVQAAVTLAVVVLLPTALRAPVTIVMLVAAAAVAGGVGLLAALGRATAVRTAWSDLRRLGAPRTRAVAVATSLGVTLCHATVLAVTVSTAAGGIPLHRLLPLVLVVQLGATVPTSVAGWGPREGIAAWAFTTMGLSAADGVAASVAYGVVALVATLPGALVIVHDARRAVKDRRAIDPTDALAPSGRAVPERPVAVASIASVASVASGVGRG